jgi:hypothetical protein
MKWLDDAAKEDTERNRINPETLCMVRKLA